VQPRAVTPVPITEVPDPIEITPRPSESTHSTMIRKHGLELERLEQGVDDVIVLDGRRRLGRSLDVSESDFLSACVRDFVQGQGEAARRPLIAAFTHYFTTCDGDGRIVLDRPLGFDRDRRSRSDASFTGTLSSQRVEVSLRVSYCGGESASPDQITIVADGEAWTSSRLEFQRSNACHVAELPFTRALARVAFRVTDAAEAVIRFEGQGIAGELVVNDGMKQELRVVLDALDALNP